MACCCLLKKSTCFVLFFLLSHLSLFGGTPKLQEQLGSNALKILKNAQFITMLPMTKSGVKEIHLNNEEMEKLKRNLLDDHNYDFNTSKSCQFAPEISFKFIAANKQVLHLFVSPICNQMLFGMGARSLLLNYDPVEERLDYFLHQLASDVAKRNKETYLTDR